MQYAWLAVAFAAGGFLLYYIALLCSHLAAFRIAKNMKMAVLKHLTTLPLGFFGTQGSGKIRKVIDENSDSTEAFIAHQLPDLVGAFIMLAPGDRDHILSGVFNQFLSALTEPVE